jgi:hypothetical protein
MLEHEANKAKKEQLKLQHQAPPLSPTAIPKAKAKSEAAPAAASGAASSSAAAPAAKAPETVHEPKGPAGRPRSSSMPPKKHEPQHVDPPPHKTSRVEGSHKASWWMNKGIGFMVDQLAIEGITVTIDDLRNMGRNKKEPLIEMLKNARKDITD